MCKYCDVWKKPGLLDYLKLGIYSDGTVECPVCKAALKEKQFFAMIKCVLALMVAMGEIYFIPTGNLRRIVIYVVILSLFGFSLIPFLVYTITRFERK